MFLELESAGITVGIAPNGSEFHRPEVDEREKGGRERYYHSSWRPGRETIAHVSDVVFGLTNYELSQSTEVDYSNGQWIPIKTGSKTGRRRNNPAPREWTSWHDMPTGRLRLRACSPYPWTHWQHEWTEKKRGDLQTTGKAVVKVLKRHVSTMVELVEKAKRQQEEARRYRKEQERQWEREREEQRWREAVKQSRAELLAAIEAWGEAKRIEEFFEDLTRLVPN